jgi:hypothetical protein
LPFMNCKRMRKNRNSKHDINSHHMRCSLNSGKLSFNQQEYRKKEGGP